MGNCVAGGGYLPVLCDKLLMTEGSGLYLAGPALVKSAIGQEVSHEELGGAAMHAQVSGTIDYRDPDDESCLERLRQLVAAVRPDDPQPPPPFQRAASKPPQRQGADLYDIHLEQSDAANTKCATCWPACSMPTALTNTNPNTAKRSYAAPRGWADFRSASSPTSIIGSGLPTVPFNSAACCTSTAPKKRRDS